MLNMSEHSSHPPKDESSAPETLSHNESFPSPPLVRYLVGEGISMTGTWMQAMAQSWVMASLTTSAKMIGLVNFVGGIPMIALSMTGGLFADKYDKRLILQICQVVQILFSLTLGYLVATHQIQIWHVILAAGLLGVSSAFEMPAASALVPELAGKKHVAKAIALDRSVFHGTRLIGPALAGYLVGHYGAATAFYINALSFLALIIALLTLPARPLGSKEQEEQRQHDMKAGFRHIWHDRPSLAMILLLTTNTIFVFPVMLVLLPLYAKNVLVLDSQHLGWLMFCSGIGSLSGALMILKVKKSWRPTVLTLAVTLICMALFSLSRADVFIWAGLSLTTLALGVSSLIGLSNTVIQERAPDEIRGRVSAVAGLSFFGLLPFAGMIMAALADWIGIRESLFYAACSYASIGLLLLSWTGKSLAPKVLDT